MEIFKLKLQLLDEDDNILSTKFIECEKIDNMIKKYKDTTLDYIYFDMMNESLIKIDNMTFIDGLTYDIVKDKYPWILKAKTKNAVIGEDCDGLIFYSGEWIDGDFINGKML